LKVAIAGAGMTGAYLYRLLMNRGHEIDMFGRDPGTKCGINPCAWGTSRGFGEQVKASSLLPEKYILEHSDYVVINGIRIKADLATYNKPSLISDLLRRASIIHDPIEKNKYDRIIDATGVSRFFLPALPDDILLPAWQWRIRTEAELTNKLMLGKIGYAWCFPLSNHEYHIGCGSLISDPRKIMRDLGWIENLPELDSHKIICSCSGKIRLTAPLCSQPFIRKEGSVEVWGVGESIGCVAPLGGDGIVPGLRSAQILIDYWDDPAEYKEAILREFSWMENERRVIDKLRKNKPLGMKDAWVVKKNSRRLGMQVGLKESLLLLRNLR
jgi:hypothetical protein